MGAWDSAGTAAGTPREAIGVITMKMINSTSNTSINGVTFIAALACVVIAMPTLTPTAGKEFPIQYR